MEGTVKAGRYKIERQIGRGGMGLVYRARDLRLSRTVALKMVPPEILKDANLLRRLAREALAASAINHPGIATVFDYEELADASFIVYEYVEGATLRQRLHERRFTVNEIVDIGIQLADALSEAHARGIIHRDLKPENIMLTPVPDGPARVKILDFGVAKLTQPIRSLNDAQTEDQPLTTAGGLLIGTVNYMSPEQLSAQPVDSRSDIYALGLVLYEMAAGTNPFVGDTPASTIANILTREAPPLGECNPVAPPELDRVIRRCLQKRREERFQSARELMAGLSSVRSHPEPLGPRSPEPPFMISRGLARGLFLLIQLGYLAMYGIAFRFMPEIQHLQFLSQAQAFMLPAELCILVGVVIRIQLFSIVSLDYAGTGRLFRRLFPLILFLDAAWAATPLLLFTKLGEFALLFVAGLGFLPFSQRLLISLAYAPSGGRSSAIKVAGSA